jgi:hypothetical protein
MAEYDKEIKRLSYSAVSQYAECGEKWKLSRVWNLDKSTWFTTLMGTAVHEATANWDLLSIGFPADLDLAGPEAFDALFDRELAKAAHFGNEVKASGKELKNIGKTGGPNRKDESWCRQFGPTMIQNWIDWRNLHNYRIAIMPDGQAGIEYEVTQPLGGYEFIGFIDRVMLDHKDRPLVIDLKTGKVPSSNTQLKSYAAELRPMGVDVDRGCYWDAMAGDAAEWVTLPDIHDAPIAALVDNAGRGIEAGVFMANTASTVCRSCAVRDYCAATGGRNAQLIPLQSPRVRVEHRHDAAIEGEEK